MSADFIRLRGALATTVVALAIVATTVALAPRADASDARARTDIRADSARLSKIDGTLPVPGLDSTVEVLRDTWGVPHIYARTVHDVLFAQGYVAAQDRLWEMEMWRRQGEGRLAEILGPAAVVRDRAARQFKYRGDMAKEWASYGNDSKTLVQAFVAGVNAQMAEAKKSGRLPIEFSILKFEPEPWTVDVPLVRVTPLSGVSNASSEVLRAQLVTLVGAAKTEQVMPSDPHRALDPAKGLDLAGIDSHSLGGFGATFADVAYVRPEGSNNWVVSGTKTATGKPILANDPHRAITHPAVRYITHLVGPGWNVIGAGEPASPGVSIGHNDKIAFGLTVVGMDQQDVYVEKLGPCRANIRAGAPSPLCVWHKDKWEPVTVVTDTIKVRGEAPRVVQLEFTHHGPIVSFDSAHSRAFAIRSVHAEPGTAAYLGSLAMDRAHDWPTFRAAMARWKMPSENMIYADVTGNIGWVAAGLMPVRSWSGLLPVPGDGTREWTRFLGIDELPQAFNPKEGFVATANHNILPKGYTKQIAYEWSNRYRIDRVKQVLRGGSKFDVADFEKLQHDDLSLLAKALVPTLVAAAERRGQSQREEIKSFAAWDYRLSRESQAALLFEAWSPALAKRVMQAVLPPKAATLFANRPNYEQVEDAMLAPERVGAVPQALRDSIALAALDEAVADLTKRFGADRSAWVYGKVHVTALKHPLAKEYDLPIVSRGGDGNTVFATAGADYKQQYGASYREVIDLADFDRSRATNVPGQSAQPGSEYYGNLLPLWGNDKYFPLLFTRAAVEKETKHTLTLVPAR